MCKADRKTFLDETEAVKRTIKLMEEPIVWNEMPKLPADFQAKLNKYDDDVKVVIKGDPAMTPPETDAAKLQLANLSDEVQDGIDIAVKNGEAAIELKNALIKN